MDWGTAASYAVAGSIHHDQSLVGFHLVDSISDAKRVFRRAEHALVSISTRRSRLRPLRQGIVTRGRPGIVSTEWSQPWYRYLMRHTVSLLCGAKGGGKLLYCASKCGTANHPRPSQSNSTILVPIRFGDAPTSCLPSRCGHRVAAIDIPNGVKVPGVQCGAQLTVWSSD